MIPEQVIWNPRCGSHQGLAGKTSRLIRGRIHLRKPMMSSNNLQPRGGPYIFSEHLFQRRHVHHLLGQRSTRLRGPTGATVPSSSVKRLFRICLLLRKVEQTLHQNEGSFGGQVTCSASSVQMMARRLCGPMLAAERDGYYVAGVVFLTMHISVA